MSKSFRLGLTIALIVIFIDQLSKWWILVKVMNPPKIIQITNYFNLVLTWNRGVSFGLFNDEGNWGAWIFSILALISSFSCRLINIFEFKSFDVFS